VAAAPRIGAVPWSGFAPCEAIFFDLDDTLIDFDGGIDECWQAVCAEAAGPGAGFSARELRAAITRVAGFYWSDPERHRIGRADLMAATRAIVGEALDGLGASNEALAAQLAARYRTLRDDGLVLYPGAVELLDELISAGHTLGVITNGEAALQRAKLERFNLIGYFTYVGIEGEAGVGKPDAEAYWRALQSLGCAPADSWMIGDNLEWDVLGPQRLGLRTVWIDRHARGLPENTTARPDHITKSVAELAAAQR
jgi:putative hydrolase of the HAD superfamily